MFGKKKEKKNMVPIQQPLSNNDNEAFMKKVNMKVSDTRTQSIMINDQKPSFSELDNEPGRTSTQVDPFEFNKSPLIDLVNNQQEEQKQSEPIQK